MASPVYIMASPRLIPELPRLMRAAGVEVIIDHADCSAILRHQGEVLKISISIDGPDTYKSIPRSYGDGGWQPVDDGGQWWLISFDSSSLRTSSALAKSLLASGGRASSNISGILWPEPELFIKFAHSIAISDLNAMCSEVAHLCVEGFYAHSEEIELPFGTVGGAVVPLRFATGPACIAPELPLNIYLEVYASRSTWRRRKQMVECIDKLAAHLRLCGGQWLFKALEIAPTAQIARSNGSREAP